MGKLVLVIALISCSSRSTPKTQETGGVGATCRCHERSLERATCVAVTCKADLMCGYPCGIDGCDSICMTRKEFEESKTIP